MRKWVIWWARFPGNLILSWQSLLTSSWICIQIILCSCTDWFQLLTYQNLELPEKRVLAVGLFRSHWPVGMSVGVCAQLSSLWPSPLSVGLFPIQGGLGCIRMDAAGWAVTEQGPTSLVFICSWLWMCYVWLLEFLPWLPLNDGL